MTIIYTGVPIETVSVLKSDTNTIYCYNCFNIYFTCIIVLIFKQFIKHVLDCLRIASRDIILYSFIFCIFSSMHLIYFGVLFF